MKNKVFRNFSVLFSILLLASCSSIKKCPNNENLVDLNSSNFEIVNGRYSDDSFISKDSIIGNLHWNFYDRGINNSDSIEFIEIIALTSNKILVKYYEGHEIIQAKVFKGKIDNNYFILKRKRLIIPGLYVNLFRNRSFRIGILENNNLITDYHQISFGTVIFIFPFYENKKECNVEFERIK